MRRPLPHEFPRSVVVVRAFHPDLTSTNVRGFNNPRFVALTFLFFYAANLRVLSISCLCEISSTFSSTTDNHKICPTHVIVRTCPVSLIFRRSNHYSCIMQSNQYFQHAQLLEHAQLLDFCSFQLHKSLLVLAIIKFLHQSINSIFLQFCGCGLRFARICSSSSYPIVLFSAYRKSTYLLRL